MQFILNSIDMHHKAVYGGFNTTSPATYIPRPTVHGMLSTKLSNNGVEYNVDTKVELDFDKLPDDIVQDWHDLETKIKHYIENSEVK